MGYRSSLAIAPGAFWNYSHLTDREIEAQKGDSTCLRAHSFKWEQALEVRCPHTTTNGPCTVHALRGLPVGAGFLAFGELEGGLAFFYFSAS